MNNEVDVICANELTTFPNRKTAIKFFYTCMCCSEGAERDRYTNIYISLTGTKRKMVHDEEYFDDPYITRVDKFVDNHCTTVETLPKAMSYKEYLKYKKNKQFQNSNQNKYYMLSIRLDKKQREYFKSLGYYCYDIRESCLYGDGGTVENSVLVNNCGSIITNKDLKLKDGDSFMKLDDLMDKFNEMSYDEFLEIAKTDKEYEIAY